MKTWTQSHALPLSAQTCVHCFGMGMRSFGKAGHRVVCGCVLRAIFRACYRRFRYCLEGPPKMSCSHIDEQRISRGKGIGHSAARGRTEPAKYGIPSAEYVADFLAIAKRTLSPDGTETQLYRIFVWHFLYGAEAPLINQRLGRPREDRELFHDYYRIEEALGRAFRETEPYGLWPLDEYFGGAVSGKKQSLAA
jgi:hypothetical protein